MTLEALRAAGHDIALVAPVDRGKGNRDGVRARLDRWCRPFLVPARPAPFPWVVLRSALGRTPVTIRRHALGAVREQVSRLTADETFDVVHAEQVQALAQCEGAARRRIPVVLRAQNVESDLWRGVSSSAASLAPLLRFEARRLAGWEGEAVRRTAATIALTSPDAARLIELSNCPHKVREVAVPFPSRLPPAETHFDGSPAVVLFGSAGWRPNEEATAWCLDRIWPEVTALLPRAVLHVFGRNTSNRPQVVVHSEPEDSREAFAEGAVLLVPLRVASGVRMKILDGWARGVPVVATPEAAQGLEAAHGRELLLARDAQGFAAMLRRLHGEAGLAPSLVAGGRNLLESRHAPAMIAAQLTEVYSTALASGRR